MKRRSKDTGTARMVAGVLVALLGVGGAASVLLMKRPGPASGAPKPGGPPAAGVGGPTLTTDGRLINVGLASSIPEARGYDTGPVDYTYNAPGWDYARLGGK